jgi:hypothetical protein
MMGGKLLHQVSDLFELNVKLRRQNVKLLAGLIHRLIVFKLSKNVSYPLHVPDKLRPHFTS